MKYLLLVLAFALACARPIPPPAPVPLVGADTFVVVHDVAVLQYEYAGRMFEALGAFTRQYEVETAGCITRWNSIWAGDTLKVLELFTAVPVIPVSASDTTFVPPASIGNCWWQLPSIHWHVYNDEPSDRDYVMAALSAAPFHIVAHQGKLRVYAVRMQSLKRNNPR